jgi:phosphotransferase system enzyme I (PtsI)
MNPWQPALIRILEKIASDSAEVGISSGVCGESASDPAFAIVLAGLGFQSLSASKSQVGAVRNALSAVSLNQARGVAKLALAQSSAESAKAAVLAELASLSDE